MGSVGQGVLYAQSPIYATHWTSPDNPDLSTGTAGAASTSTIDTVCSQIKIEITDPINSPLPAFSAYTINPVDNMGAEITDLSGNMRIYARVRSKDTVQLAMLLRSGGGTSAERTNRVEYTVPGSNSGWHEFEFVFDGGNLAGFDSLDLRDIWLYLDRGVANFAGNEFYMDYVSIGAALDSSTYSLCQDTSPPSTGSGPLYTLHWNAGADPSFSGSSVLNTLTQNLDTVCSQLSVSVIDTGSNPLDDFAPFIINPKDDAGADIVDISNDLSIHARVRSKEDVMLGLILRGGDGTSPFRTNLQEQLIPGDTANWTEVSFVFDTATIGGFDATDLRDVWFYLDRGTDNFAGNEFSFDYVSIGGKPDSSSLSTCPGTSPPNPVEEALYTLHWSSGAEPTFSGSSVISTVTQTIDSACSQLSVFVTDPTNSPLDDFGAFILNPKDSSGADIVNISNYLSVHTRVRSKEDVMLGLLLRAGDGSSAFRTDLQEQLIPGDTANWTEVSFVIDTSNIGGFDSTDLRDVWFYLDRGTDNFAGNEFYFDYVSIGSPPPSALNSMCPIDTAMEDSLNPVNYILHWNQGDDPEFSGSSAASLTQVVDSACSQIQVSVTDPMNTPLTEFQPIIVNPKDSAGSDIIDLSGSLQFHVRVRSRDSVMLGFLLRSGDGTSANRSILQEQVIPGDTMTWTEITFTLDTATLGGFDSTDLRDVWFYLDRGEENFAGNELYVDYVAIGEKPDPADNSPCSLIPLFDFPYVLHWADTSDRIFSGSGADQLTQTVDTACSQLLVEVTDPLGDPHAAFKPLIINPQDEFGNDITDLSGQMTFYTRVRSLASVELGMVLRAGDGTSSFRTEIVSKPVPGDLSQWTELVYTFNGADYGGFDSTDLRDFWFYLNREEANFPGNEFYFDYVAIGSRPNDSLDSDCVETVGINDFEQISGLNIYPNPSQSYGSAQLEFHVQEAGEYTIQIMNIQGRLIQEETHYGQKGLQRYEIKAHGWTSGLYMIQVIGQKQKGIIKWMIE